MAISSRSRIIYFLKPDAIGTRVDLRVSGKHSSMVVSTIPAMIAFVIFFPIKGTFISGMKSGLYAYSSLS